MLKFFFFSFLFDFKNKNELIADRHVSVEPVEQCKHWKNTAFDLVSLASLLLLLLWNPPLSSCLSVSVNAALKRRDERRQKKRKEKVCNVDSISRCFTFPLLGEVFDISISLSFIVHQVNYIRSNWRDHGFWNFMIHISITLSKCSCLYNKGQITICIVCFLHYRALAWK